MISGLVQLIRFVFEVLPILSTWYRKYFGSKEEHLNSPAETDDVKWKLHESKHQLEMVNRELKYAESLRVKEHELLKLQKEVHAKDVKLHEEVRAKDVKLQEELRAKDVKLQEELRAKDVKLQEELRAKDVKLQEELRAKDVKLQEELRAKDVKLQEELRAKYLKLQEELRAKDDELHERIRNHRRLEKEFEIPEPETQSKRSNPLWQKAPRTYMLHKHTQSMTKSLQGPSKIDKPKHILMFKGLATTECEDGIDLVEKCQNILRQIQLSVDIVDAKWITETRCGRPLCRLAMTLCSPEDIKLVMKNKSKLSSLADYRSVYIELPGPRPMRDSDVHQIDGILEGVIDDIPSLLYARDVGWLTTSEGQNKHK